MLQRTNSLNSPTILVVEDMEVLRNYYKEILTLEGYRHEIARDGEEGWKMVEDREYDLIITDHDMPRLTGLGLINRLKLKNDRTPIILVSGTLSPQDLRLIGLGLFALIQKPFAAPALLKKITEALVQNDRPPSVGHS